ncbi:hypothetical protein ACFQU7_37445 [Pseudoroseomonas wenyumeiae]|uniref:hypothetical protein n=1 Tax=Teichococcus wenyumeiae TaxID=2478470 RepID=UPI0011C3C2A1|nr:hypothetical protein [Pseudoroseomonas wenyumeiae]
MPRRPAVEQRPEYQNAGTAQGAAMQSGLMAAPLQAAGSFHDAAPVGIAEALALPGGYAHRPGTRRT